MTANFYVPGAQTPEHKEQTCLQEEQDFFLQQEVNRIPQLNKT